MTSSSSSPKEFGFIFAFQISVSILNSLMLIFVWWYCTRKIHFWNPNLHTKEHGHFESQ